MNSTHAIVLQLVFLQALASVCLSMSIYPMPTTLPFQPCHMDMMINYDDGGDGGDDDMNMMMI